MPTIDSMFIESRTIRSWQPPRTGVSPAGSSQAGRHMQVLTRFVADLAGATALEHALDILHDAVMALGFPGIVFGMGQTVRNSDGSWNWLPLATRNLPANWDRDWASYRANDPYLHVSYSQGETDWASVQAQRRSLTRREQSALAYIDDIGLRRGYTISVRRRGHFAAFTAIGEEGPADSWSVLLAETLPLLRLITHYFESQIVAGILQPQGGPSLSRREAECLEWSARGKTVDDIATILGISPDTVKAYFKRINQKLDTVNRSQAIARAISLNIIGSA